MGSDASSINTVATDIKPNTNQETGFGVFAERQTLNQIQQRNNDSSGANFAPVMNEMEVMRSFEFDDILDEIDLDLDEKDDHDDNGNDNVDDHDSNNNAGAIAETALWLETEVVAINTIASLYEYRKQLGTGASCRVLLVSDRKTKQLRAAKEMKKTKENKDLFERELDILRILNANPNVVQYYAAYVDQNCYYIIMEYCAGGTMIDRIIKMQHFNEKKAASLVRTILETLQFMHSRNIVHRDMKCQNLMFDIDIDINIDTDADADADGSKLKLIDFGNSQHIQDHEMDNQIIGGIRYLSPDSFMGELRNGAQLKKGDLWAVGVITYTLVTGKAPFTGSTKQEIIDKIVQIEYTFPENIALSAECKHFIQSLFKPNSNDVLSAADALKHTWIVAANANPNKIDGNANAGLNLNMNTDLKYVTPFNAHHRENLKLFRFKNKLQHILIKAIFKEMNEIEQQLLLTAVRNLDNNNNSNSHQKGDTDSIQHADVINYLLNTYSQMQQQSQPAQQQFQPKHNRGGKAQTQAQPQPQPPHTNNNEFMASVESSLDSLHSGGLHLDLIDFDSLMDEVDEDCHQQSPYSTFGRYQGAYGGVAHDNNQNSNQNNNNNDDVSNHSSEDVKILSFDFVASSATSDGTNSTKLAILSETERGSNGDDDDFYALPSTALGSFNSRSSLISSASPMVFAAEVRNFKASTPDVNQAMSVRSFRGIMDNLSGVYDVDTILAELAPSADGMIPLQSISAFQFQIT